MEKKITITVFTSDAEESDEFIKPKVLNELSGFDFWGNVEHIKVNVETVEISEEEIAEWRS